MIEDGVWVGAKAMVCPGVTLRSHSVITVGTVARENTELYTVHQGNPAVSARRRRLD